MKDNDKTEELDILTKISRKPGATQTHGTKFI